MLQQAVLNQEARVDKVRSTFSFLGSRVCKCDPNHVPYSPPSLLILQPMRCNMQGENARMSAFVGAIAIADLVKTTLGPKGMDKILQSVSGVSCMGNHNYYVP